MSEARKKDVLRRMLRLADRKSNDSVRLAFLSGEGGERIADMDLGALTELKRHGNGAVEVKLVDRLAVLEALYGMVKDGGDEALGALLDSLDRQKP